MDEQRLIGIFTMDESGTTMLHSGLQVTLELVALRELCGHLFPELESHLFAEVCFGMLEPARPDGFITKRLHENRRREGLPSSTLGCDTPVSSLLRAFDQAGQFCTNGPVSVVDFRLTRVVVDGA
jgi:hypothetical protein